MNEQNEITEDHADTPEKTAAENCHTHVPAPKLFKRLGRELAMQFLFQCDVAGMDDFAENLENFWNQAELSEELPDPRACRKARAYAEKIIAGVCEHEADIDRIISEFSARWDISRMPVVDRNIIRVAVFELYYCPDIPALVSINEAIEIAKDYSSDKSGIFINGLLNAIKDKLPPHSKIPSGKKAAGSQEKEEN